MMMTRLWNRPDTDPIRETRPCLHSVSVSVSVLIRQRMPRSPPSWSRCPAWPISPRCTLRSRAARWRSDRWSG